MLNKGNKDYGPKDKETSTERPSRFILGFILLVFSTKLIYTTAYQSPSIILGFILLSFIIKLIYNKAY